MSCHARGYERRSGRALFVGREVELSYLVNAAESADEGEAQAVLVRGEASVGKTRLVEEPLRILPLTGPSQESAVASRSVATGFPSPHSLRSRTPCRSGCPTRYGRRAPARSTCLREFCRS
ncbi:ATP-binding protein [Micromonospora sp. NPDC049559]|uniref:ATP-binding protein n=1 Tax=Micromonospora sp. NPDC049559 TaxID=3155923 RepID=UPI003428D104